MALHVADCPMTHTDTRARTGCVCGSYAAEDRTEQVGRGACVLRVVSVPCLVTIPPAWLAEDAARRFHLRLCKPDQLAALDAADAALSAAVLGTG